MTYLQNFILKRQLIVKGWNYLQFWFKIKSSIFSLSHGKTGLFFNAVRYVKITDESVNRIRCLYLFMTNEEMVAKSFVWLA